MQSADSVRKASLSGSFVDNFIILNIIILLTWQGERITEFHDICGEFRHHKLSGTVT